MKRRLLAVLLFLSSCTASAQSARTLQPEQGSDPGCRLPATFPNPVLIDRLLAVSLEDSVEQVEQTMQMPAAQGYQTLINDPAVGTMLWTVSDGNPAIEIDIQFHDRKVKHRGLSIFTSSQSADSVCYWSVQD